MIKSHTNYEVYFGLLVKTTMQPALYSLKIPILWGVKKAGRERFRKHQNPKSCKKSYDLGSVDRFFYVVVRSQQNPMYGCNFESSHMSGVTSKESCVTCHVSGVTN